MHYIPKDDVPITTGDETPYLTGNVLYFRQMSGVTLSGNIGVTTYNGGLNKISGAGGTIPGGETGLCPTNLWTKSTNTAYNTVVYLFQRTA